MHIICAHMTFLLASRFFFITYVFIFFNVLIREALICLFLKLRIIVATKISLIELKISSARKYIS